MARAHRHTPGAAAVLLGVLAVGTSARAEDAADRFHYDDTLARCVNARGEEGFNPPPPGRGKVSRDSECVDLSGRVLMYVSGKDANFRGARLDRVRFLYLNSLAGADLTGSRMRELDGSQVDLTQANLAGADLTGARLTPCPPPGLSGACLTGARFDARTILPFDRDEALARGMVPADGS